MSKQKMLKLVGAGLVTAGIAFSAIAHEGHQRDGVVGVRTADMKDMGGAMKHLGGVAKGDEFSAASPAAAARIHEVANAMAEQFPEGSGPGGEGIGETRAKPEIWSDPEGFAAEIEKLKAGADSIVAAVTAQDRAALGAAMQQTGGACGSCHKAYRVPKK
ncbi:MAG: c-type cytochrome [Alphaproteobacteria bacterium]